MISKLDQLLQMHLEITWLIKTDNTKKVCNIQIKRVNLWEMKFKTFNNTKIHTENNWCMEITINQMCHNKPIIICINKWWQTITMEIWIICMIKWANKNKTMTSNKILKNPNQPKWFNNNSSNHNNKTIINKEGIFTQDIIRIIINKDTNKDNIITATTIITSNSTITIIIRIRID